MDLTAETVEIRRQPAGEAWDHIHMARRGETIAPVAFPELAILVDDILP